MRVADFFGCIEITQCLNSCQSDSRAAEACLVRMPSSLVALPWIVVRSIAPPAVGSLQHQSASCPGHPILVSPGFLCTCNQFSHRGRCWIETVSRIGIGGCTFFLLLCPPADLRRQANASHVSPDNCDLRLGCFKRPGRRGASPETDTTLWKKTWRPRDPSRPAHCRIPGRGFRGQRARLRRASSSRTYGKPSEASMGIHQQVRK